MFSPALHGDSYMVHGTKFLIMYIILTARMQASLPLVFLISILVSQVASYNLHLTYWRSENKVEENRNDFKVTGN